MERVAAAAKAEGLEQGRIVLRQAEIRGERKREKERGWSR
jgi:hypothetical protein